MFRALGIGAWWETRTGARWTQFYFDPILFAFAGRAGLGTGATSGHISRAGRLGLRNSIKLNLHIVSWVDPFASIFS